MQGDGNRFLMTLAFQATNMMPNQWYKITYNSLEYLNTLDELAHLLRKLVVQEWLRHPERYESASDNSGHFSEEAERFLNSGDYFSSLGDAMPLSAANVLEMPLVILT